jgi:hypothetical protein
MRRRRSDRVLFQPRAPPRLSIAGAGPKCYTDVQLFHAQKRLPVAPCQRKATESEDIRPHVEALPYRIL